MPKQKSGEQITAPSFDVAQLERQAVVQALTSEIGKAEGYIQVLRNRLAGLNGAAKPMPKKDTLSARIAKMQEGKPAAKGGKALDYLKSKAGEWVAGTELAKIIGTDKVSQAIKASSAKAKIENLVVEKRGPGRKREYRIKP